MMILAFFVMYFTQYSFKHASNNIRILKEFPFSFSSHEFFLAIIIPNILFTEQVNLFYVYTNITLMEEA